MKIKYTLLLLLFFSTLSFSQYLDKSYHLLQSKTETKILYDRVFNLSDATKLENKVITSEIFKQVYHEIQRADFLERLPKFDYIKEQSNIGFAENQVPLSILITEFESIKKEEIDNGNVFLNINNQFETKKPVFLKNIN